MIAVPCSVLLDAQALSALAVGAKQIQVWLAAVELTGSTLYVSAATLAETTDGTARDANLRRVVRSHALVMPVVEQTGYDAGRLRALAASSQRKPRDLTVDALVAATALALPPPVVVLTSDSYDLLALLDGTDVRVYKVG